MSTNILRGQAARDAIEEGVTLLADAVASTLGPKGQNVAINRGFEDLIIHDGVRVANEIEPAHPAQLLGARVLREAAQQQVEAVGDGTTVTTILGQAIFHEANKQIASGINPMGLRKGLEAGRDALVSALRRNAIPVTSLEQKQQVARISAEDEELGNMIGSLLDEVGLDGIVTVEEDANAPTTIERQAGMQFAQGYRSPLFVTDPSHNEATVEDAYILITDREIFHVVELLPFFEAFSQAIQAGQMTPNLVVVAKDCGEGSFLATMVRNKTLGTVNTLAINAPLVGPKQTEFLQDIAILTGATMVTKDSGMALKDATVGMLGHAVRVTATKDATLIVGGLGSEQDIALRVASLKSQLEEATGFDAEKLRERIAKLTNGVAVIKVGGHTEIEMKERRERAIDAVAATQAAIRGGIVPGGETAYMNALNALNALEAPIDPILERAIRQPFLKLMSNAGLDGGQYMERLYALAPGWGIDVVDGTSKDLIAAGIIDPVEVPINALQNAVSVAVQLMTVDTVITTLKEDKKP